LTLYRRIYSLFRLPEALIYPNYTINLSAEERSSSRNLRSCIWSGTRTAFSSSPFRSILLSHSFWLIYLNRNNASARKSALGFLRSYVYLIRHESDFRIAQREGLVPENLASHEQFCAFLGYFKGVADTDVSPRYSSSGELRLSRLNFYTRIFLFPKRLTFFHVDRQWDAYFASIFALLLLIFAVLSIILGSMQVVLAAQQLDGSGSATGSVVTSAFNSSSWSAFSNFSRWFSVATLLFAALVVSGSFAVLVFFFVHDI
jgi:hypothetical protein